MELFEQSLLWDGPPIRLSNKGHLRLATYLFKYFAHVSIIPTTIYLSEPRAGHQLVEVDAVAVSHPHRVWYIPATLLLPSAVAKNINLKIGVSGSADDGKVRRLWGSLRRQHVTGLAVCPAAALTMTAAVLVVPNTALQKPIMCVLLHCGCSYT